MKTQTETLKERQYGSKNQHEQTRPGRMDCRSVHQGTGTANRNNHERPKLEKAFQGQAGAGGLVQGQPALLQEKDSRGKQPFCKNVQPQIETQYEISSGKRGIQLLLLYVEQLERGRMQDCVRRHVPSLLGKMVPDDGQGSVRGRRTVLCGTVGHLPGASGGTGR